jgi:hypothetical protein
VHTMDEPEHEKIQHWLKQSLASTHIELERDLWPRMRRRLDQQSMTSTWLGALFSPAALSTVPWFDWALLAALLLGVCIFPNAIPIWLYHL